jgi:repressor LexA
MARTPSTSLTNAQKRVLEAVLKREKRELPNFVSDLVADLALKAESSLGATLQRMARLGVIVLQGGGVQGRQRLVVPTEKGRLLCSSSPPSKDWGTGRVPLGRRLPLLGFIPAGPLEEVISSGDDWGECVEMHELLQHREGDFLLRIKGDSMVGDGIFEDDLVLLRPGVELQQGEIAAVIAKGVGGDCDATLKHVFRRPGATDSGAKNGTEDGTGHGEVLLRASNPAYADILLPAESVQIAGVFRGLIRTTGGARAAKQS